jgi:hypothetical protein
VILSTDVTPLLTEGTRKLIGDSFKRYELEGKLYLNMQTSAKASEVDREVTSIGALFPKGENSPISLVKPVVGRAKTYTFTTWAGGVAVSWEADSDELYGFIRRAFASLGKAANETLNLHMVDLFNRCDSADPVPYTGFDGLALLHGTHTAPAGAPALGAGAASDNQLAFDLSESALQTALIQSRKLTDHMGNRISFGKPNRLVTTVDNMFLVEEILRSEGKPFTADNTTNVLKGIIAPTFLTYANDPDRWLVQMQDHDMNFIMRTPPVTDSYDDKATLSMVSTIALRDGLGFGEWRSVIGSPGV